MKEAQLENSQEIVIAAEKYVLENLQGQLKDASPHTTNLKPRACVI